MASAARRGLLVACALLWLGGAAGAGTLEVETIPLGFRAIGPPTGIVALTDRTMLVPAQPLATYPLYGPLYGEEVTLLVELGSTRRGARVTPLDTPGAFPVAGQVRLSPTRVLLAHTGGPDRPRGTYVLDDLGGENRVTDLPDVRVLARLSDDRALVTTADADGPMLLSEIGSANRLTPVLPGSFAGPVVLSETSALFAGPCEAPWPDEHREIVLVRGIGVGSPRVDAFDVDGCGPLLRMSRDRVAAWSTGLPGTIRDDELLVLDRLASAPRLIRTHVRWPGTSPVLVAGEDRVVQLLNDTLSVVDRIGGFATFEALELPASAYFEPLPIGGGDFVTVGWDGLLQVLRDPGGSFSVDQHPVPGSEVGWGPSGLLGLPSGALVVSFAPGLHPESVTLDVAWLPDLAPGAASPPETARVGELPWTSSAGSLHALGGGRAAWTGDDLTECCESRLHVVSGFDDWASLEAEAIQIHVRSTGARPKARLRARATLRLAEPERLLHEPVTIRVGGAWQTLPAGAFEETADGFRYVDRRGVHGFLRDVRWDPASGELRVRGHGRSTGAETTTPGNVTLSVESESLRAAVTVPGELRAKRIRYLRAR